MWKIKFNNVQDLSDARFAASAMAEWVGFSISGDKALSAESIQEIISWCSGPKLILETSNESIEKINSFLDVLPVNGIECSPVRFQELKTAFPDVQEWIVSGEDSMGQISHSANWQLHAHINTITPSSEMAQLILKENPFGFSINCEKETEIGKKDLSIWHDFFEELDLF